MTDDHHADSRDERTDAREHHAAPITPDDAPSALERGVRIFERLRRRS